MEYNEFELAVQEMWKKQSSELRNAKFVAYSDDFFNSRAPSAWFSDQKKLLAEYFYYRNQIDISKLFKLYQDESEPLVCFDVSKEVPLMLYDNRGLILKYSFLVTNCNMYYRLTPGKRFADAGRDARGHICLSDIQGKVEVEGWANFEIVINGNVLGGIDIKDSKKSTVRMLESYLQGIAINSKTFFAESDAGDVEKKNFENINLLKQLNELCASGIITKEEFEIKKRKILGEI